MLKLAVMVSGGGTNLQAILDAIDSGSITNARVVKAVSYTHLDVYKRQSRHRAEAPIISVMMGHRGRSAAARPG